MFTNMRRLLYILTLSAAICTQDSSAKGTLTGYLTCASFNTSSGHSYVESYLAIIGQTARFVKQQDNMYQAKVSVAVSFWLGDSIVAANKYYLHSMETADSLKKTDFIDVQRYWLKKGVYTMKLTMSDANDTASKPLSVAQKVKVGFNMDSVKISDVEFLQSYEASNGTGVLNKCGFQMVPYVYSYYPDNVNKLQFYAEIYNAYKLAGPGSKFVLKYFIESSSAHNPLKEYVSIAVKPADTISPVVGGFNIDNLSSGSYSLVIQVIDKDNKVRASRSYNFIRGKKGPATIDITNTFVAQYNNKDTLAEYIKSLAPIANSSQKDFINSGSISLSDIVVLKEFFYNFWVSQNQADPQAAWVKYMQQVEAVNKTFGTYSMKGYQTDRGRVYLEYGPPNQRVREDMNPTSYPYEIWEYYKLKDGEVDRKFVFYQPDLVTNNYVLLHSTARGEVQNPSWQLILNSRIGQPDNVDQNSMPDPYGENATDEFNNPR